MKQVVGRILLRTRPYLWPFILVNSVAMTSNAGARISDGLWLGTSLCLVASFGFLVNDLRDRDVDELNGRGRFESLGPGSCMIAALVSLALLIGSVVLAFAVEHRAAYLVGGIAVGLVVYSLAARRLLFSANILAAVLSGSPLWAPCLLWGGQAVSLQWGTVATMLLLLAAREVVFDLKDSGGDAQVGRRTIATVYGENTTLYVAAFLVAVALIGETAVVGSWVSGVGPPFWVSASMAVVVVALAGLVYVPVQRMVLYGVGTGPMRLFIGLTSVGMILPAVLLLLGSHGVR